MIEKKIRAPARPHLLRSRGLKVKIPKRLEKSIQQSIMKRGRKMGWRVYKRSRFDRFGSNGEPDLEFMRKPRALFFMEVKSLGEKSSNLQKAVQEEIKACGFNVYRDVDSVELGWEIIDQETEKWERGEV